MTMYADDPDAWPVRRILAERPHHYRVEWVGKNPKTGKSWPPDWVKKDDVSEDLVNIWERKKVLKEERKLSKGRASTASSKPSARSSRLRSISDAVDDTSVTVARSNSRTSTASARAHTPQPREEEPHASSSALLEYSRDSPSVDDITYERPRKKRRLIPEVVITNHNPERSSSLFHVRSSREADGRSASPRSTPSLKGVDGRHRGRKEVAGHATPTSQDAPFSPLPMKIGPPRGHKRKRRLIVESQDDTRSTVSHLPVHEPQAVKPAPDEPHQSPRADAVNSHALEVDPDYGQFDFDVPARDVDFSPQDTFSRDGLVPETQPHNIPESPRVATEERPDTVTLGTRPSSVKSRMKPRSGRLTSDSGANPVLPALSLPPNRRFSRELPTAEGESHESDAPKRPVLRPVPVLSPSVFRPYLPVQQELEPPTSSIEQFSSPEKGSKGAVRNIFQKVERCIKAADTIFSGSTRDDESLRLRGQQLAEDAAARNRRSIHSEDDYSHLFRESASPEPVESSSADEEVMVESTLSQLNDAQEVVRTEVPILQEEGLPGDPTEALANAYIDFDAAQTEQSVPIGNVAESRQPAEELSTGPNMTGIKPKLGFLQEVRKNRTMINERQTQRSEREPDRPLVPEEYPLTTSTQQADVDSQSLERSALSSQNVELMQALEEAHARCQSLEQSLSTKNIENIQLQTENEDLAAALEAANNRNNEYSHLHTEASSRCALIKAELISARSAHDNERQDWERRLQEHQDLVSRLQATKQDVEKDRDMFREYYGKASAHVSEMRAKEGALEEELSVAKSQLSEGLALLRGMYEERVKRTQAEVEKWKSLCKILTEKDELTTDEVRRRAAEAPELREEVERLKLEVAELRAAKPVPALSLPQELTPESGEDVVYICQYVDVPNACVCNATFNSPEEVQGHALHHHYPELSHLL